jgi:heme/copper-type cytochrome/quinol oxidase subunit 2
MKASRRRILLYTAALAVVAAVALFVPAETLAQCPLCRSALEHGGDKTARVMNLAIVVLLVPPVSIFCTIFAVAYRKRKGEGDDDEGES